MLNWYVKISVFPVTKVTKYAMLMSSDIPVYTVCKTGFTAKCQIPRSCTIKRPSR